jgi:dethiobiotin synthetase
MQNQKGIFVTGTDTGIGKTFVSAILVSKLKARGITCCYYKPISTGCELINETLMSEDLIFINKTTNSNFSPEISTPIRYRIPASPFFASIQEEREIDIKGILEQFKRLSEAYGFTIVEGIGGIMVPITKNYFVLDLINDLNLPALVVSRPILGTINHTLMTLTLLKQKGIRILGFVTNGEIPKDDPTVSTNSKIIEEISGVQFLGHVPFIKNSDPNIASAVADSIIVRF